MDDSEKQMISGVINNHPFWQARFRRRFEEKIFRFVRSKVKDVEDARELVEDTFISAFYSLPSFSGRSSLLSWILAIARHEVSDFYRKRKIKTILFSLFPGLEKIADAALSPEMRMEEIEIKMRVKSCLAAMSEGYREILRLKYIEGRPTKELAVKYHLSVKAVEMRLRRARLSFIKIWHEQKQNPALVFADDSRIVSFLKKHLGIVRSPLSDTPGDSG